MPDSTLTSRIIKRLVQTGRIKLLPNQYKVWIKFEVWKDIPDKDELMSGLWLYCTFLNKEGYDKNQELKLYDSNYNKLLASYLEAENEFKYF